MILEGFFFFLDIRTSIMFKLKNLMKYSRFSITGRSLVLITEPMLIAMLTDLSCSLPYGFIFVHPPKAWTYAHTVEPFINIFIQYIFVKFSNWMNFAVHSVINEAAIHQTNKKNVTPIWKNSVLQK